MIQRAFAIWGLTALSACVLVAPNRETTLADGDIAIRAPGGYCVDAVASRASDDFAVLAPCATLGVRTPAPETIGLVTVQAGAAGSGSVARDEIGLRDFLITPAGTALLSQRGTARDIAILSTQAFDDQVMVHFTDQADPPHAGLQNEEWRAFRDVGGRLVTVAVRGLAVAPLADGPGAGLLKLVLAGIRSTAPPPPAG